MQTVRTFFGILALFLFLFCLGDFVGRIIFSTPEQRETEYKTKFEMFEEKEQMDKLESEAKELLDKIYIELQVNPTDAQKQYCTNTIIKHLMFR